MKKLVSPITMFFFGIITFAVIMIITHKKELDFQDTYCWFCRVLIALTSASICISIPGMLKLDYNTKGDGIKTFTDADNNPLKMSLLEKEPTISTSGAIAVFVLVCLFNPLV